MIKFGLPLTKNVIKTLAENVLIPLKLTAAASAADTIIGLGTTTLLISNKEMENIIKIVKSVEKSGLLIKRARETTQNESKEQKVEFFSMLLASLGAGLLGNLLTTKDATAR